MGASHSKSRCCKRFNKMRRLDSTNSSLESTLSMQISPYLSRSSSTINSRANSILGKPKQTIDTVDEQDRLTNTHFVLKHCFGDNFSAPVHDLLSTHTRVLDVACGFGVWVLDMATEYPHAEFHGINATPIYPKSIKPSNTHFQQCDLLDPEGFPYPNEHFDYIHMRFVYDCFSSNDLEFVLNEMNRVLKPGGYIEIRDIDPTIKNPGPVTDAIFSDFATRMCQIHSIDVTWTKRLGEILKKIMKLTDVHHQCVSIGFDNAEGLVSVHCSFIDTIKSYKNYLMKTYDMSANEYEDTINCITNECNTYHSYFNYYMSWGRKPLTPGNWIQKDPISTKQGLQHDELLVHDIARLTCGFTE